MFLESILCRPSHKNRNKLARRPAPILTHEILVASGNSSHRSNPYLRQISSTASRSRSLTPGKCIVSTASLSAHINMTAKHFASFLARSPERHFFPFSFVFIGVDIPHMVPNCEVMVLPLHIAGRWRAPDFLGSDLSSFP